VLLVQQEKRGQPDLLDREGLQAKVKILAQQVQVDQRALLEQLGREGLQAKVKILVQQVQLV
jgi:hypothetical protein